MEKVTFGLLWDFPLLRERDGIVVWSYEGWEEGRAASA